MRRIWTAAVLAAMCSGNAGAQPTPQEPGWGFEWEAVGDRAINQFDDLAVGHQGRVWTAGSGGVAELRVIDGVERWFRYDVAIVREPIVVGDTVWYSKRPGGIVRQVLTEPWPYFPPNVLDGSTEFVRFGSAGSTGEGRLYAGAGRSLAYSDGRGLPGTWTPAPPTPNPGNRQTYAEDMAFFPANGPWPNRILYSGEWGVAISDDRGGSWRTSSLWAYLDQMPEHILTLARPGGGINVVALGKRNRETCGCTRVYLSQDGGEAWTETAQLTDDELAFLQDLTAVPIAGQSYDVPSYETPSAVALLTVGRLWQTDDGGVTWSVIGQAPYENISYLATDILFASDGRLYVTYTSRSPTPTWVWRTAERFPVASAAGPPPASSEIVVGEARPNPAVGGAALAVALPRAATVEGSVFDALGRRVAVVAAGEQAAGTRDLAVPPLAAGSYLVRVVVREAGAPPVVEVRRLTVAARE